MSEVSKKSDRLELNKIIEEKEEKVVRSVQDRIQILLKSIDTMRFSLSDKKSAYDEKQRALEMEKIIAEKAAAAEKKKQEELLLAQQEREKAAEAARAALAEKQDDNVSDEPAPIEADYKPRPGDITDITVEDFLNAPKKKISTPIVKPKIFTHEDKPSQTSLKKTPLNDKDKKRMQQSLADEKKKTNKKEKIKKGYEQNQSSIEYDEISGEIMKVRVRKSFNEKKKTPVVQAAAIDHAVLTSEDITIKQLSEKIGRSVAEIIKKLFFEYQIVKTINDNIDFDTAELVASDFGVSLQLQVEKTSEEKLFEFHDEDDADAKKVQRPPIVTVMGHVDHGKTSILDYIRKANVASGEAGGITQHIGAYTILATDDSGTKQPITFLDTPGHEAFTAMRARGANITDIAVIVVAADDGIMPQTVEAINHAKAAKVSIIVAINKMDKPEANPDKVLQQLADNGLLCEDWGGDIPCVRVSAKTGKNIDLLLKTILLTAEILELKANPDRSAHGTILEAKLDKGKGPVATCLVQNGTLHTGDFIVAGMAIGRVRAMFDDKGRPVSKATPSMPVSVLGLQEVPNAGDQMMVVVDEKLSKQVVEERKAREKIEKLKTKKTTLEDVFNKIEEGKLKDLNIILKADVQGSVEAVKSSLVRLSNDEVKVQIVHSGVGAINESDITLADTTNAIIIGFNIRPDTNAKALAEKEGVDIRLYRVIYDAIDDVEKAIKGMLAPTFQEVHLGRAEVRQLFHISSVGTIAGCMVKEGKITKNAKARLLRDNVVVFETAISSLRRMKDDVKEVLSGFDCGIGLVNYNDIHEGDVIEAYTMEENQ